MKALSVTLLTACLLTQPLGAQGLDWLEKKSPLSTEKGALYVEDILEEPIKLRVLKQAPIYYQLDMRRHLGTMARGTEVTIVALSDKGLYRVRGKATHGGVSGWMRAQDLAGTDPKFAENLRKLYARQKIILDLVKNKQIALGMTPAEVVASIGKPSRTAVKIAANGKNETYEYITYDRVPQYRTTIDQYGRPFTSTYYVKVETGKLTVTMKDGSVSEIEETEGNPLGDGGLIQVPPPIVLF